MQGLKKEAAACEKDAAALKASSDKAVAKAKEQHARAEADVVREADRYAPPPPPPP